MKTDYQMKCCDLEEALRLSDIRKSCLEDQLEQDRQCLSFLYKESAKLIAENNKLLTAVKSLCGCGLVAQCIACKTLNEINKK